MFLVGFGGFGCFFVTYGNMVLQQLCKNLEFFFLKVGKARKKNIYKIED